MDMTLSTIAAMRRQEASYMQRDFLHQSSPQMPSANGPAHVDIDCRSKMTAWCYQVVDFCKFHRETVEIAMNYADRFLATPAGLAALSDRTTYQLAVMTALYTAVKLHEPEAMDPKLVSNLSRGAYTPQQVEAMEAVMLGALQWKLNPPTALSFVRQYLDLLPGDVLDAGVRQTAYDITKYQTELAVNEYDFCSVFPSTTAYCSLVNSLESMGLDAKVVAEISRVIASAAGIDVYDDKALNVQNWLYSSVVRQPSGLALSQPLPKKQGKASRRMSVEVSPTSVSTMAR